MPERRQRPSEYRQAQLAARKKAGALGASALRDVQSAVKRYADEIARELKQLPQNSAQAVALAASRDVVIGAAAKLEGKLKEIVSQHRVASFEEIQGIWQEAGLAAAHAVGVPNALLGGVLSPNITMAGAYEAIGGAGRTWKTLLTGYSANAAKEADALIRNGLISGMSIDSLSQGLREYATALSPTMRKAFKDATPAQLAELETAARQTKNGLKTLRFNASRIAISETHNARAEAEVQHFAADPMVDGVFWRLSPNRGKTGHPDACDVLAQVDMYGMGPGCYPVSRVPLPPHPHDRCERVPRVRRWEEFGAPKPEPTRIWNPLKDEMNLKMICEL